MVSMRKELIGLQGVLSLLPILIALVGLFLFCVSGLGQATLLTTCVLHFVIRLALNSCVQCCPC